MTSRPAGPDRSTDEIFALLDRKQSLPRDIELLEVPALRARLPDLKEKFERARAEIGLITRALGIFVNLGENHLEYLRIRDAYIGTRNRVREIEQGNGNEAARVDRQLRQRLQVMAERVLRNALIQPRPIWSHWLTSLSSELEVEEGLKPQTFAARVHLIAHSKNPAGLAREQSRAFTVVLRGTRGEPAVSGAIRLDASLRSENPYLYDYFETGSVIDLQEQRVAASSLDQWIETLRLSDIDLTVTGTILRRMRKNSVLRRQVQQVSMAAVKLQDVSPDRDLPGGVRNLLRAYLNYWAKAEWRSHRDMLKSAFLIKALLVSEVRQRDVAQALDVEFRRGPRDFSRDLFAMALQARVARSRGGSLGGADEGLFTKWFWVDGELEGKHDVVYVGPRMPFHEEISRSMGTKSVDDPRFVLNEYRSDPYANAVFSYVDDAGRDILAHGSNYGLSWESGFLDPDGGAGG